MTIQHRLIMALEARGYRRNANSRGSKFIELVPQGEHRLGRAGALRYTRTTPVSDRLKKRLLEEGA